MIQDLKDLRVPKATPVKRDLLGSVVRGERKEKQEKTEVLESKVNKVNLEFKGKMEHAVNEDTLEKLDPTVRQDLLVNLVETDMMEGWVTQENQEHRVHVEVRVLMVILGQSDLQEKMGDRAHKAHGDHKDQLGNQDSWESQEPAVLTELTVVKERGETKDQWELEGKTGKMAWKEKMA